MEPLDLSIAPPRAPHAELGTIIFLPRTIDKARAMLPGGNIGLYKMDGFSTRMFGNLGFDEAAFVAAVASSSDDAGVLAFVHGATTPEKITEWNAWASQAKPRGGDREAAIGVFPFLAERAELPIALDAIAEDDQRSFA